MEIKLSPSSANIEIVKITKVVKCCKNCKMVYINDVKRTLCPFCGSFYDSKEEREKNTNKPQKILKNRKSMNENSDNDENGSHYEKTEYHDLTNSENGGGIRNFFKNLVSRKNNTTNGNIEIKNNKQETEFKLKILTQKQYMIVEDTNLSHRFLTIKNIDCELFSDYRKDVQTIKTVDDLRNRIQINPAENNLNEISDFFCWVFSKSTNLSDILVTKKSDSQLKIKGPKTDLRKYDATFNMIINWKLMKELYTGLAKMPKNVIDLAMTSISFCIANDIKPMIEKFINFMLNRDSEMLNDHIIHYLTEIVNIYTIYLCNPLLKRYEHYTLFAIILSDVSNLSNELQQSLILAMRRIPLNLFREMLTQIQQFMSSNLDSSGMANSFSKVACPLPGDWMTAAVKVMALLHCTNEMQIQYYQQNFTQYQKDIFDKNQVNENERPSSKIICSASTSSSLFISYKEFYIPQLNKLGLFKEYLKWQKIDSESGFSFCQYPFLLDITSKREILEQDSEQQMISIAKKSYINRTKTRREAPRTGDLFLTIKVNRDNLVSDSMNEIEKKSAELKKKCRIEFINEAAIDMGGVRKEWFLLLVRQIFSPLYGMFNYIKESNVYWFTTQGMEAEYNLIGVVMGLAVYNSEMLDIHFPPCVYKKLLPSSMSQLCDPKAIVGTTNLGLYDLKYIHPTLASSLQELLDYEGDVEGDFLLRFEVSFTEFDVVKLVPLKENGHQINLTNENRKEYVSLYVDFLLNKLIYKQFAAFYHGFHSVCASNAVILLRSEEIEALVCGSTEKINIDQLKEITVYDGYTNADKTINWFWCILKDEFTVEEQKRLLLFTTGSDRIPIGGTKEMAFKISRIEFKNQLPMSHTCFNQLVLPNYKTKEMLYDKLKIAIENAEGFGFK